MTIRSIGIALAVSASLIATPAFSGTPVVPPGIPTTPSATGAGPWVVGGVALATVSVMYCAYWACATTRKEMSAEQAAQAALIPFSCLWWPYRINKTGPACKK